jgi:hypothetical protein
MKKMMFGADLILWALPEDLIEGLGLHGYVVPVEPDTDNAFGTMLGELLDWYGVANCEILSCLMPATTVPHGEYIDGQPVRFINILTPEMEKGEACESFYIDVE